MSAYSPLLHLRASFSLSLSFSPTSPFHSSGQIVSMEAHIFPGNLMSCARPDWIFHYFRASKSIDWSFELHIVLRSNGFWCYKIVKGSVGLCANTRVFGLTDSGTNIHRQNWLARISALQKISLQECHKILFMNDSELFEVLQSADLVAINLLQVQSRGCVLKLVAKTNNPLFSDFHFQRKHKLSRSLWHTKTGMPH